MSDAAGNPARVSELVNRLTERAHALDRHALDQKSWNESTRLHGKAEGVRMAIGMIEESERDAARVPGPRIPWSLTANAIGHLRRLVAERGTMGTQELDQLRATIRDELDKLDVSLRDPVAVYHGMVWTGLVTELARYGYNNGAIGDETYRAVSEIATTIASALLDYVPSEVGR